MTDNPIVSAWQADMRRQFQSLGLEHILEIGRKHNDKIHGLLVPHTHARGELEITYVDKGMRSYVVGGKQYDAHGGEVLVVKPGDTHQTVWPFFPARLYWIKIQIPANGDAFLNLRGRPARSLAAALRNISAQHFLGTPAMKHLLERIIALYLETPRAPATPAVLCILVLEFLLLVLDCAAQRKNRITSDDWTNRINRYIDDHIAAPVHIDDMAKHMEMSVSGFKLRFDRQFGVAPAKYVAIRKVSLAKTLLTGNPHLSVTEIAMDLGFASSQHFASVFKRVCGDSPRSFRQRSGITPRPK